MEPVMKLLQENRFGQAQQAAQRRGNGDGRLVIEQHGVQRGHVATIPCLPSIRTQRQFPDENVAECTAMEFHPMVRMQCMASEM